MQLFQILYSSHEPAGLVEPFKCLAVIFHLFVLASISIIPPLTWHSPSLLFCLTPLLASEAPQLSEALLIYTTTCPYNNIISLLPTHSYLEILRNP